MRLLKNWDKRLGLGKVVRASFSDPKAVARGVQRTPTLLDGLRYKPTGFGGGAPASPDSDRPNPLREFFKQRTQGHGIWKWDQYFDLYDRHFSKFKGKNAGILEIGIFSGGSLEMWRDYFGPDVEIIGVDIEDACMAYERPGIRVFIGDQSDREFLSSVADSVERIDMVVDDGSHVPAHQIISFEEIFPRLAPGGVYVCEDVHGSHNPFLDYAQGLVKGLNDMKPSNSKKEIPASSIQAWVKSINFYPYSVVIEKADAEITHLLSDRKGDIWQPFNPKSKTI